MFNPLNYLKTLYSILVRSIEARLPNVAGRRAISTTLAAGAVVAIVGAGGVIIYLVVTSTGPTTSTYP